MAAEGAAELVAGRRGMGRELCEGNVFDIIPQTGMGGEIIWEERG